MNSIFFHYATNKHQLISSRKNACLILLGHITLEAIIFPIYGGFLLKKIVKNKRIKIPFLCAGMLIEPPDNLKDSSANQSSKYIIVFWTGFCENCC